MKPLEIINLEKAKKVLQGKQINDSTEDELKAKLKIIYAMIGLRPQHFPVDEEKAFLHTYIYQKYGNKTLNELILAFDLAIQGQLEVDDAKVYDQFTCEYLAKIMNAYRNWLKFVTKNAEQYKNPDMIEDKKELSDEEKADWICDWKSMKNINIELIPLMFYDFLTSKAIISLTSALKWEYTNKATQNVKTMLQDEIGICKTNDAYFTYNKFQNEETLGFTEPFKGKILNRAKRLIVYDYLKAN